MIGITIVFMGMMASGTLEAYEGAILFALLVLYLYSQFRNASRIRTDNNGAADDGADYLDEVDGVPTRGWVIGLLLVSGLVLLPLGADFIVESASRIARSWHVSDEVIGLTIVAIGTSLPELATTVMAVFRKNVSVALGNVVGSNIFNIAAIMGITAMVVPLKVGGNIVQFDMWVMLATSLLVLFLAHFGKTIKFAGGLAMVLIYCAYIGLTLSV